MEYVFEVAICTLQSCLIVLFSPYQSIVFNLSFIFKLNLALMSDKAYHFGLQGNNAEGSLNCPSFRACNSFMLYVLRSLSYVKNCALPLNVLQITGPLREINIWDFQF